jgi:hypothetical protein
MLDFLVSACAGLSVLATRAELPIIAYLLKVATLQAEQQLLVSAPEHPPPAHPLWPPGTVTAPN